MIPPEMTPVRVAPARVAPVRLALVRFAPTRLASCPSNPPPLRPGIPYDCRYGPADPMMETRVGPWSRAAFSGLSMTYMCLIRAPAMSKASTAAVTPSR